jgi:outer membrane protein assembly factor BamB
MRQCRTRNGTQARFYTLYLADVPRKMKQTSQRKEPPVGPKLAMPVWFCQLIAVAVLGVLPVGSAAAQQAEPALLWRFMPQAGAVYDEPVVAGSSVFVSVGHGFDPGGEVYALDASTGESLWQISVPESLDAGPVAGQDAVYIGAGSLNSGRSAVYALDAATGEQRWRVDVTNPELAATPIDGVTLSGDTLYVQRMDGYLHAFVAASGEERWRTRFEKPARGAPVVDGTTVYVALGFDGGILLALDAASGEERWRVETADNPSTAPTVSAGFYYVGLINGDVLAMDAATGEERWRGLGGAPGEGSFGRPSPGRVAVADGTVYVTGNSTAGATVVAFDAVSGDIRWKMRVGEYSGTAPAISGQIVYVGSDDGSLRALDSGTGGQRWRFMPPVAINVAVDQDGPPIVAGGTLYISDESGGLLAISIATAIGG